MNKLRNFSLEWDQVFNLIFRSLLCLKKYFIFIFIFFLQLALAEVKIGFVKVDEILKECPTSISIVIKN
jgi:hypothetical protein